VRKSKSRYYAYDERARPTPYQSLNDISQKTAPANLCDYLQAVDDQK
jgi:hypothetical protein